MKEGSGTLSPEVDNALQAALPALQPDMAMDEIRELLVLNEKKQVMNTIRNADTIISCDPLFKGAIKFNLFSQRIDIVKDLGWTRESDDPAITDDDLNNIHLYFDRTYGFHNKILVAEAVSIYAHRNSYHPVRDLLNSLSWDGEKRIRRSLKHFLGAEESDYSYAIMKTFMLGAISRVFHPGIKFDCMLCIVGLQGAGKSSFFKLLAIRDEWFTDSLNSLEKPKETYETMEGHWIIEMSEMLATINAKSEEVIKSFLSRTKESYRNAYGRFAKDRPRQCVFAGTTNKSNFLPLDRTGNRRFWPIRGNDAEAEVFVLDEEKKSREYILQMWAEAMEIYRSGDYSLKLPREMEAEVLRRQQEFLQEDVDAGTILGYMESYMGDKVCSKQLFKESLGHEYDQPTRKDINSINEIMNMLIRSGALRGWRRFESPRRFGSPYGTQKGWERIPVVEGSVSSEKDFMPVEPEDRCPFTERPAVSPVAASTGTLTYVDGS